MTEISDTKKTIITYRLFLFNVYIEPTDKAVSNRIKFPISGKGIPGGGGAKDAAIAFPCDAVKLSGGGGCMAL